MSFQAYLDAAEEKTGRTPAQLLAEASAHGFDASSRPLAVCAWLKEEHALGRGNAMALVHILRNGPVIADAHVGSTGSHRDASTVLHLDGRANRPG